jgi:hypothetical protein
MSTQEALATITLPVPQDEINWLEAVGFHYAPGSSSPASQASTGYHEWKRTMEDGSVRFVGLAMPDACRPYCSYGAYRIDSAGAHFVVEHTERHQSVYSAYSLAELRGWRKPA